jgi:hypothetical protein
MELTVRSLSCATSFRTLGQRVPEGGGAAVSDAPALGALAAVGSVVRCLNHRGSQLGESGVTLSSPFRKKTWTSRTKKWYHILYE